MEPRASVHPADETLVSYGLGKLDDTLAESVNKHLEQCVPCRRRVAELSSDSFVGRLRDAQARVDEVPPRPKTVVEPDPPRRSPAAGKQASAAVWPVSTGALPSELVNHLQVVEDDCFTVVLGEPLNRFVQTLAHDVRVGSRRRRFLREPLCSFPPAVQVDALSTRDLQ